MIRLILFLGLFLFLPIEKKALEDVLHKRPLPSIQNVQPSFAPGTPQDYIDEIDKRLRLSQLSEYNLGSRWYPFHTATGDGGFNQGDPLTLTWSIVPDGTSMEGQIGEPTCSSTLQAYLAQPNMFGADWLDELTAVFDEWASLSGNVYILEPNDDGAIWPTTSGLLGVRGDIRIGGCPIDGNGGILAYNQFPSGGDMKIDAPDTSLENPANQTTRFHNVVSHESGHGQGLVHVCPQDGTKLMEPLITTTFLGPRLDDIRGIQRHYGDSYEVIDSNNDNAANATDLGNPTSGAMQQFTSISIDDDTDEDWFKIVVDPGKQIDINISPIGFTYEDSDQSGSCPSAGTGPFVNAAEIHDLSFELIDSDGTTVLFSGNLTGLGEVESVAAQALGAAGDKYIRIFGDSTDDIQLYNFQFTVNSFCSAPPPVANVTINLLNSTTASLDWDNAGSAFGYEVWHSNTNPAFSPGMDCGAASNCTTTANAPYSYTFDPNLNYFYIILASNACGDTSTQNSNSVGSFSFFLENGTS